MTVPKTASSFLLRVKKRMQNLVKSIRGFFSNIFSNTKASIGFCILVFFVLMAVFGPIMFPYDTSTDWTNRYADPSAEHWLGTDELGRDVFRQLVNGSRDVMVIAFMTGYLR